MITGRAGTRRNRRFDREAGETPIVDVGHVLGPLARGEGSASLEACKPVFWVISPDHQERALFLADCELVLYAEDLLVHSAPILPCSTSHSSDSFTACSEL